MIKLYIVEKMPHGQGHIFSSLEKALAFKNSRKYPVLWFLTVATLDPWEEGDPTEEEEEEEGA